MQTETTAKLKKFIEELAEDYRGAKINLAEDTTKMTDTMSGNLERLYERGQAAVDRLELVRHCVCPNLLVLTLRNSQSTKFELPQTNRSTQ